ncbi:MAG: AAA family ATPase [Candidatus Omnitrophica bacterium]|nr:AAA family ATPase [Candidatus Omnitrophota bacterium]
MHIEINEQFKNALDMMERSRKNVFITGKAGTGKSTLLTYFRSLTAKKIVFLAPTGVAAVNIHGETIHSFFGFKPDITIEKIKKRGKKKTRIFKALDAIVIDEISMVRADLMDCVDIFLRLNGKHGDLPFGGIQMIFIGDLYQLPPVVNGREKEAFAKHYRSPYFFDARVFENFRMEFIELEKIYRQKDEEFINLLNAVRNNSLTEEQLRLLNQRAEMASPRRKQEGYAVYLTTTNKMALGINDEHLCNLKSKIFSYQAEISGEIDERSYPSDGELRISKGAQVMLLNNDAKGRWVNGSIGTVTGIEDNEKKDADIIEVLLSDGSTVEVIPHTWDVFHFSFNEETSSIDADIAGSFTQYPLKLAWAITIHKSQGKTFDRVVIDTGTGAFAHGQIYVALSRCTSFEGIILKKPIRKHEIMMDWRIVNFVTQHQYDLSDRAVPLLEKIALIEKAIKKQFSLEIVYLKANDEKSRRIIKPFSVGERKYDGVQFVGVEAHCLKRGENRTFRVDRILEMKIVN